jgi:hypothetical protein
MARFFSPHASMTCTSSTSPDSTRTMSRLLRFDAEQISDIQSANLEGSTPR